jgi:hypothetical protein
MPDQGARSDRRIIALQLLIGFLLIVFGACLAAFGGLGQSSSVAIAVIGVGATLLPGGAAGSASARILQALPTAASADIERVEIEPSEVTVGNSATGYVFLTAPAPPSGFTVTLAVSDDTAATLSTDSLTIAPGAGAAAFTVTSIVGTKATSVGVTVSSGTTQQQTVLNLKASA